jgi:hypothetical protein
VLCPALDASPTSPNTAYTANYTCTSDTGLPDSFTLSLKVNVTNPTTKCHAENDAVTATATGDIEPTVGVQAVTVPAFCVADSSVRVNFTVTSNKLYLDDAVVWTLVPVVQDSSEADNPTCHETTDRLIEQEETAGK